MDRHYELNTVQTKGSGDGRDGSVTITNQRNNLQRRRVQFQQSQSEIDDDGQIEADDFTVGNNPDIQNSDEDNPNDIAKMETLRYDDNYGYQNKMAKGAYPSQDDISYTG